MIISQGAEAHIIKEKNLVIKHRISKGYRNEIIDLRLRKRRTKKEGKTMQEAYDIVPVPKIHSIDDKEMKISMEFIDGPKLRDALETVDKDTMLDFCKRLGKKIALLHNNSIIHGDLTTSNFILKENEDKTNKIFLIDFGLSFTSDKVEDKAVDLHLLRQALETKHYKIFDEAIKSVFQGYEEASNNYVEIKKRFDQVEMRGRNKGK